MCSLKSTYNIYKIILMFYKRIDGFFLLVRGLQSGLKICAKYQKAVFHIFISLFLISILLSRREMSLGTCQKAGFYPVYMKAPYA